jgi:polar amino acid transport system substrate-binding protein
MWRSRALLLALIAVVAAVMAGCGSSSGDSGTSTQSGSSGNAASTSGGGGSKGTLRVGTITGVLPYESFAEDGKTMTGFEPELIDEAAKRMGMKVKYTAIEFDSLIPGLQSNRFDLVAAGMIIKKEREAVADAIWLTTDKFGLEMKADLAKKTKTASDLCGLRIGVLGGSGPYLAYLEKASKDCQASGKKKIELPTFDADSQGYLAVKSGQIDGYPGNVPLLADFAKKNPGFAPSQLTFLPGPTGMYAQKGGPVAQKFADAVNAMIKDGTYAKILDKWGVGEIGVKSVELNPPVKE